MSVDNQIQETVEQDIQGVTVRFGMITCSCGAKKPLVQMYKCLYCSEWFCFSCAENHFGKTVDQYRQENPLNSDKGTDL
ncbi:hypothetical protein [Shewanella xiamenensis]|uniref:hypothetical protein n=1 Tax=Shewanella xiamenensis TaxID=332186 RepID=UPI00313D4E90